MERRYEPMDKLRYIRKAIGFSSKQLADKSGVSINTINAYERGERPANLYSLTKLAKAMGCNVKDLITDEVKIANKNYTTIAFEELKNAATPLVELLRKKGHPLMTAIVTDRSVSVNESIIGVPLDYDD